ncbi:adenylate cyclase [Niveibacterium umoris]|uniref:TolB-like protein n=1 Tax=Niveibacterium umoris TaxID=1193620 RepID=A0A840BVC9_9RHOO|nr:hypothetical protein [Niveibacterium umoris]MBB4014766.1 TolB-like protein [Niveibacterium umoris]
MDFTPEQIRQQVAAMVASEGFVASQRSRRLLEFLTEETLAGRGERLKGFYIACEFLGRGADFDPLVDPIVRIEMGKLRRALELYYLTAGRGDAIRVALAKGNYQPQFLSAQEEPAHDEVAPVQDGQPLLGRASVVLRCAAVQAGGVASDFAGGLAHQLAALLNRLDDVYVLAAELEDAASARFLLTANVRGDTQRLRVAVQLEDRLQGLQVWADTYTEAADDLFALEDELARRIVNRIADPNAGEMFRALGAAAGGPGAASPEVVVARFNTEHMRRLNDSAWQREARRSLEALVAEQPGFAAARAALSKALHDAFLLGEADRDAMQQALEHAAEAVRLEPESQHALAALTNACIALGQHDHALQAIERSVRLNRTGHSARAIAAVKLIMLGDAERAEALLAECAQAPGDASPIVGVGLALLAWFRGDYAAALAAVSRDLLASNFWGGLVLTVSLAETGDLAAARRSLSSVLAANPAFARAPGRYLAVSLYRRDWQERLLTALEKAGLSREAEG